MQNLSEPCKKEENGVEYFKRFKKEKRKKNTTVELYIQQNYSSKVKDNNDFLRQARTEGIHFQQT